MPTDRGSTPPAYARNRHPKVPLTGPLRLEITSWLTVGVGLHLTVPGIRRDGREGKFSSREPSSSTSSAQPPAQASGLREQGATAHAQFVSATLALRQAFHGLREYPRGL
jgi:hypothetical protein